MGTTTVRVAVAVDPDVRVTLSLSSDESKGNVGVESRIVPENPPTLCRAIVEDPLDPAASVRVVGLDEIVKSGDGPPGPNEAPLDGEAVLGARNIASITGTKQAKKTSGIATNFREESGTEIRNSCVVR